MIRPLPIHGTLAESLRERAYYALGSSRISRDRALVCALPFGYRPAVERAAHHGRRTLALLRAADKIDARAARDACHQAHHLRERTVSLYVADEYLGRICPSCAAVKPSDGLHYAEGQLFNVKNGERIKL